MLFVDLQNLARTKADEETDSFINNTELNRYLNQGYKHLYSKIVARYEDYFITEGTALNGGLFDTVAGTYSYDLPEDLFKLVRAEYRRTGGTTNNEWIRMQRLNLGNDQLEEYKPLMDPYIPAFGYTIAGNKIILKPQPDQVFSVRLWYVPLVAELVDDGDIPVIPDMYHELISDYAALQCLRKSGEGIWRESADLFAADVANMLETIEIRDQNPEQMQFLDDYPYEVNRRSYGRLR